MKIYDVHFVAHKTFTIFAKDEEEARNLAIEKEAEDSTEWMSEVSEIEYISDL